MLTQEILKDTLIYDAETGIFTWKENNFKKRKGKKAGYQDTKIKYIRIKLFGKLYLAHRLAWLYVHGEFPEKYIDHINQIKTDNRLSNLRAVDDVGNLRNRARQKNNKSGFNGVCFEKNSKSWKATIGVNGIQIILGNFKKLEDAIEVRKKANIEYGFHENHGVN